MEELETGLGAIWREAVAAQAAEYWAAREVGGYRNLDGFRVRFADIPRLRQLGFTSNDYRSFLKKFMEKFMNKIGNRLANYRDVIGRIADGRAARLLDATHR